MRFFALFFAFTAALFACFALDPFHVLEDEQHRMFVDDGERLVRQRVLSTTRDTPLLYPGVAGPEQRRLYRSQVGLPGILAAAVAPEGESERLAHLERVRVLTAFLTAAVLGAFFASAALHFGLAATIVAIVLAGLSPYLLGFSRSTFFSPFLFFLPFVVSWLLYPGWVKAGRRPWLFYAVIAALVCAKGLSGYEYITTTAAGALVPIVYYEWTRLGDWLQPLVQAAKALVAGVAGFFAAIVLHGLQLYYVFGPEGVAVIMDRAKQRTVGNTKTADTIHAWFEKLQGQFAPDSAIVQLLNSLNETLLVGAILFSRFFIAPAINLPGSDQGRMPRFDVYLPVGFFLLVALVLLIVFYRRGLDLEDTDHRLVAMTVFSLIAPLSWQILAWGHMIPHGHLNAIVFFVPTLLLSYIVVGRIAVALWRALPFQPLTRPDSGILSGAARNGGERS